MIENWVYRQFDSIILYHDTDLRVPCPFCNHRVGSPDHDHHLHISIIKNVAHCFRCDYSASHIKLVMDVDGCSYGSAVAELDAPISASEFKTLTDPAEPFTAEPTMDMPQAYVPIAHAVQANDGYIHAACAVALKYLQRRGFSMAVLEYYGIGIWSNAEGYGKIVIPVERGFWQERSVFPNKPKYISPPISKGDRLFNWSALSTYDHVIICEGAFSAMSVGKNAIALIGKHATREQVVRLAAANPKTYTVALDADALSDALELADALHRAGKVVIVRQYAHGDPNSCNTYIDRIYGWDTKVAMMLS